MTFRWPAPSDHTMKMLGVVTVILAGLALPARADGWHAGINLRTELGAHVARVDTGIRHGALDLIAVLDPMFWTDGEIDVDLLGTWQVAHSGYGVLLGWRPASIALADGRQFQHSLLVGAVGPLPNIGPLDVSWGIELGAVLVKHGGGLPMDTVSLSSTADLGDNFNASMFLRVGYAGR